MATTKVILMLLCDVTVLATYDSQRTLIVAVYIDDEVNIIARTFCALWKDSLSSDCRLHYVLDRLISMGWMGVGSRDWVSIYILPRNVLRMIDDNDCFRASKSMATCDAYIRPTNRSL